MDSIIDFEALKVATKMAVVSSLAELKQKSNDAPLIAYALCTDDCVMTLFSVACTGEWLDSKIDKEQFLLPTEWDLYTREGHFKPVYELLLEKERKRDTIEYEDKFEEIVQLTFNAIVLALKELRNEHIFSENIYLSVQSTDPGEDILAMSAKAINQLNSDNIVQEWAKWTYAYC